MGVALPPAGAGVDMLAYFWRLAGDPGVGPACRYGHSVTMVNGKLYLFGGYSNTFHGDLFVYNGKGMWIELPPKTVGPRPRFGHMAFEFNHKLYIFGGDCGFKVLNDLWQYDPNDYSWTLINISGEVPEPRVNMGGAVIGNELVIFGGNDPYAPSEKRRLFNDIHRLDMRKFTWKHASECCSDTDGCREQKEFSEDSATVSASNGENNCESNTEGVEIPEEEEEKEEIGRRGKEGKFALKDMEIDTELPAGNVPEPRKGHVVFAIYKKFYLFGGSDGEGHILNDLWRYDLEKNNWKLIYKSSNIELPESIPIDRPSPRMYPAVCSNNDHVYIFGGVANEQYMSDMWEFNGSTETFMRWNYDVLVSQAYGTGNIKLENNGNGVTAMVGASAKGSTESYGVESAKYFSSRSPSTETPNNLANKMVRPSATPSVVSIRQESQEIRYILPTGRFGAAMDVKYNTIVMFGGCSNSSILSDTWELKIRNISDSAQEIERVTYIHSETENKSEVSYKLALLGFKKFIENEVEKLDVAYSDKDEQTQKNIETFKSRLEELNEKLSDVINKVDKSCLMNDEQIRAVTELVESFEDENGFIVSSAYEMAQNTQSNLDNFRNEVKIIMEEVRSFLAETDKIIEEKRAYNETLLIELAEKKEELERKMEANLQAINNKLEDYEKQLDNFDQKIQSSTNKLSNIEEKQLEMYAQATEKVFMLSCDVDDCKKKICERFDKMKNSVDEKLDSKNREINMCLEDMLAMREETLQNINGIRDEIDNISKESRQEDGKICSMGNSSKEFIENRIPKFVSSIDSQISECDKRQDRKRADIKKVMAQITTKYDDDAAKTKEELIKDNEEKSKESKEAFEKVSEEINKALNQDYTEMDEKMQNDMQEIKRIQEYAPNINQEVRKEVDEKIHAKEIEINEYLDAQIKQSTENVTSEINEKYNIEREALENEVKILSEKLDADEITYADTKETTENIKIGVEDIKERVEGERGGIVEYLEKNIQDHQMLNADIELINKNLEETRDGLNKKVEELFKRLNEFRGKLADIETTTMNHTMDFTERREAAIQQRNDFDEELNNLVNNIDDLNVQIENEKEEEIKKMEDMHCRLDVLDETCKTNKEELMSRLDNVDADIVEADKALDNDVVAVQEIRENIDNAVEQVSKRVGVIVEDAKHIKESTDRFEQAQPRLDEIVKGNEELNNRITETHEYVDKIGEELKTECDEKTTEVHNKMGEVKNSVQEYIDTEMKPATDLADKELFEVVVAGEEPMQKFADGVFEAEKEFEENKERIAKTLGEMRENVDQTISHITEVTEPRVQSIEELLNHIIEEENINEEILQHIEDNINAINTKHVEDCDNLKKEIDGFGNDYQNQINGIVQYYTDVFKDVDFVFMKRLPASVKQLEVDAEELNSAILETKMQVKSHATQLSAMKSMLRDLATVGNRAYESTSMLIGKIKSGEGGDGRE